MDSRSWLAIDGSYDKGERIPRTPPMSRPWSRSSAEAHRHRATDQLAPASAPARPDGAGSRRRAWGQSRHHDLHSDASCCNALRGAGAAGRRILGGALVRDMPHPSAVRLVLERRREDRGQVPPVAMTLPDHVQARDVAVAGRIPLETYDALKDHDDEKS